jgi:hypothetical protein
MQLKELYEAPDFTVIRFATEDAITQSNDNEVDEDDIWGNS